MSVKKLMALITAILLFATLAVGCTKAPSSTATVGSGVAPSGSSESGTLRVGMVTPDADHGFTGESVAHAEAELKALKESGRIADYKFEVGGEASLQIAAIETILQWNPDVIVMWPLEGEQLRNAAQTIVDAGVKLVIYDRLIDGFDATAEIMGDNETIGEWTGDYLLKYFADDLKAGDELTYLRFIGDSSTVSIQRSGGMDTVIKDSEYAEQFKQIHEDYQTDWSNAKAQEQMENWLTTASPADVAGLDFIVTHDDEIVDGLVVALENYTKDNPSVELDLRLISGVGGRKETLATFDTKVAHGIELVTYFFSPSFIREAIRLGVAAGYGEQYDAQAVNGQLFLIPSIEVDKDTVEKFRSSDEFKERYSI